MQKNGNNKEFGNIYICYEQGRIYTRVRKHC